MYNYFIEMLLLYLEIATFIYPPFICKISVVSFWYYLIMGNTYCTKTVCAFGQKKNKKQKNLMHFNIKFVLERKNRKTNLNGNCLFKVYVKEIILSVPFIQKLYQNLTFSIRTPDFIIIFTSVVHFNLCYETGKITWSNSIEYNDSLTFGIPALISFEILTKQIAIWLILKHNSRTI